MRLVAILLIHMTTDDASVSLAFTTYVKKKNAQVSVVSFCVLKVLLYLIS